MSLGPAFAGLAGIGADIARAVHTGFAEACCRSTADLEKRIAGYVEPALEMAAAVEDLAVESLAAGCAGTVHSTAAAAVAELAAGMLAAGWAEPAH